MKISLQCENLLLQSTLEYFLKDYVCEEAQSDFVLSDTAKPTLKPLCLLGSKDCDILQPFTPQSLMQSLKTFYNTHCLRLAGSTLQSQALQNEVEALMQEYTKKLVALLQR